MREHNALPRPVIAGSGARQMDDSLWLAGLQLADTNHGKTMTQRMRFTVSSQLFQSRRIYKRL